MVIIFLSHQKLTWDETEKQGVPRETSILPFTLKLRTIIQSEASQKDKDHYNICVNIYMEFRKMLMTTLYAKQKKRHRCIEQPFGLCGRRRGWDVSREKR